MNRAELRKLSDQEKRRVVGDIEAMVKRGVLVEDAYLKAGISKTAFYKWRKKYPANGTRAPVAVNPPLQLTPSIAVGSISSDELTKLHAENAKMRAFIGELLVDAFLEGKDDAAVE